MALTQHEIDKAASECILTMWARGHIETDHAKRALLVRNYDIDFRQIDNGATMSACYIPTGEYEELTI